MPRRGERKKRGSGGQKVPFAEEAAFFTEQNLNVLALDEALTQLARIACDWYQQSDELFTNEQTRLHPNYARLVKEKLAACRRAVKGQ